MTEAMPFLQKAILLSYAPRSLRKGVFNLTRTGIEQGGGAQHRNQSPSGALVSPRVPTARNVYRGCCRCIRSGDF